MNVLQRSIPLVSVVIAAYHAAATLGEDLRSIWVQTHPAVDVVVVDDGSTDGRWELLRVRAQGPAVRAFRQINGGIGAAHNRGMLEAPGQYIALLDADDTCDPGRL